MMFTPLNSPIKRMTIMTRGGVTLYHRSVEQDKFDEFLFSGLTSAILSFSREMGQELTSIRMHGLELYIRSIDSTIIVIGVNPEEMINVNDISALVDEISSTQNFKKMVIEISKGVQYFDEEFDKDVQYLMEITRKEIMMKQPKGYQFDNIVSQVNRLRDNQIKPKELAIDLIGKELTEKETESKRFATEMIQELLNSANLEKDLLEKLNIVLKYMMDRTTRASTKTSKALF